MKKNVERKRGGGGDHDVILTWSHSSTSGSVPRGNDQEQLWVK